MYITATTNTNYVTNPNFETDVNGWSVNNGNLTQNKLNFYSGSASAQFVPYSNYAYMEYDMIGMTTGAPYIAQARVMAGAGQQVFIQFADGSGFMSHVASGGWDLITTSAVMQNNPSFGIQIGLGSELLVTVEDGTDVFDFVSATSAYGTLYGLSVSDSTVTSENYTITTDGGWLFTGDYNSVVSDSTVTSENWSIQVGAQPPFVNGFTYYLSVTDTVASYDITYVHVDLSVDRTIFVDNVMVERNLTASTYFDGNSGQGYHWYGVQNESISFYRQFETTQATSSIPQWGVLISWTKQTLSNYNFFTIGTSTIGGQDFIAGTSSVYPTFFNQYVYGNYSDYLMSASATTNIGQYPYGAFGAQLNIVLDNSTFLFLPGFDPVIGNYITARRPIQFQVGFNGESLNLFSGSTAKPTNDIQNRTVTITAYDGMDYLNSFISTGAGTVATANNGNYVNIPAQNIIADLLEEAGFYPSQFVLEQSLQSNIGYLCPSTYTSSTAGGVQGSIGGIISDICQAEQALFFFDGDGIAHFWNREHIPTNTAVDWSFDYSDIVNFQTEDTPIINDVTVKANPRVVQAKQNIWQLTSSTIIPPTSGGLTVTNMAINPNFIAATGGYFNSGVLINVQDTIVTAETLFEWLDNQYVLRYNVNDFTQTSESISVFISDPNKLQIQDSTSTSEVITIQVGSSLLYKTPISISVSDSSVTMEQLFTKGTDYYKRQLIAEYTKASEVTNVLIPNAFGTTSVSDSTVTYESYNLSTVTVTGWATQNAALYQNTFMGPTSENASGQLTTLGGSTSYLYQQYTCTTSTQYVTQCQVKGIPSTTVIVAAVQRGVVLNSQSVTLDGNWDTISVPAFVTNPTDSTFQVQIYTQNPATIYIGAVMTQNGVGALTTYFDGQSNASSSYIFSWSGAAQTSTSIATPVGSAVIEADFSDNNGALPVTSVTSPVYNNPNLDSSFLTNFNSDNTGATGNSFIQLQSVSLNGSTYLMTFINTGTQPVYITQLTLYGTPAKVTYNIDVEYKNPTSIVLYGTNPTNNGQTLVIQNDLIQDPSTALSDAYTLVNDYANPYQRMTANVFAAYMLQVGDNVNITINDTGQTEMYTIVGVTNGVGNNGEPQQSFEVEVKKLAHYFTINQSAIGGSDSIAP